MNWNFIFENLCSWIPVGLICVSRRNICNKNYDFQIFISVSLWQGNRMIFMEGRDVASLVYSHSVWFIQCTSFIYHWKCSRNCTFCTSLSFIKFWDRLFIPHSFQPSLSALLLSCFTLSCARQEMYSFKYIDFFPSWQKCVDFCFVFCLFVCCHVTS